MRWWNLFLAAILVGCGAESPSSSKSPVTPPPPVVLTTLSIVPGHSKVGLGEAAALTVLGTWSNGTSGAVAVDWSIDDPTVATLTGLSGTFNSALGLAEGTCTITATNTGIVATATLTVEWSIPADPGPVYASAGGQIRRYLGSAPPTTVATGSFGNGFVLNAGGDQLYTLVNAGGSAQAIDRIDPATGSATRVGSLPSATYLYFGLDYDADGRLYTINGGGAIARMDPATGATETLGSGPMYHNSLAIGPDGDVFTTPLYTGGGSWISRFDPAAGTLRNFGNIPLEVLGSYGIFIPAGVVIDRKGRATIGDYSGDAMWRYEDLNGDGDARDAGEVSRLATLPTGYGATTPSPMVFGTALAGGGSILVNCDGTATAASAGIYWLTDRNNDGDCDDAGEITFLNSTRVNNGLFGTCLQAKR